MPGKTIDEYVVDLRELLQDHPQFNRLLLWQEESGDGALRFALRQALDRYNYRIPPFMGGVTFESFPADSLIVQLAASTVLEMVGVLRTRNSLNYSDAGLSIRDTEKSQDYRQWALQFKQEALSDAMAYKQIRNVQSILYSGGIGSSYGRL